MKLKKILNEILIEGKQVGVVYHFTAFHSSVKILKSNLLNANRSTQRIDTKTISTTRDKNFVKIRNGDSTLGGDPEIGFVLDGTKLSNRYKVMPYDDTVSKNGERDRYDDWGDEQEELWYGNTLENDNGFKNFKTYLIKVIFTKKFMESVENGQMYYTSIKELGIFPEKFFTTKNPSVRLKFITDYFDGINIKYDFE